MTTARVGHVFVLELGTISGNDSTVRLTHDQLRLLGDSQSSS